MFKVKVTFATIPKQKKKTETKKPTMLHNSLSVSFLIQVQDVAKVALI